MSFVTPERIKDKKLRLIFPLDEDMYERIRLYAYYNNKTKASVVREALRFFFAHQEEHHKEKEVEP